MVCSALERQRLKESRNARKKEVRKKIKNHLLREREKIYFEAPVEKDFWQEAAPHKDCARAGSSGEGGFFAGAVRPKKNPGKLPTTSCKCRRKTYDLQARNAGHELSHKSLQ